MAFESHAEALHFIEEMTSRAGEVQKNVLAEILNQNAQTEYLRRFNLHGATDSKTFKSKVPVISYEDIRSEIQRIANGDRSPILTSHPVFEFFNSSGTTSGEVRIVPMTQEEWERRQVLTDLLVPVMSSHVPDLDKGKGFYFYSVLGETRTPGGHATQPVLTRYYKSEHFKRLRSNPYTQYTSPDEAIRCTDYFQSMYVQMLCGLYAHQEVNRLGAAFASGMLRVIRFLEQNWPDLVHDIRTGSLNPKITDGSIQECMKRVLKPNPEMADFISKECSNENWERIIPRIWPNAKYLDVTITGTMAQYASMLDYYSGGLPTTSTMYACSECVFGINLNPLDRPADVSYTIVPNLAYYEFIAHHPPSDSNDDPELIDLVDVEEGKEYEIVVTTYAGLYRYHIGDILKVVGFHNSAPKLKFMRRKNVLLSIDADKTDETELQRGIEKATQLLRNCDARLLDYSSQAYTKEIPGHYVIYWELLVKDSEKPPSDEVLGQCCLAIENSFNKWYRDLRAAKSISALEIRVVESGAFQRLMEHAISKGASVAQYKVPRCVKLESFIQLLDSKVVSTHFSPCIPHTK